ncbi:MAG: hypothetical protein ACRDZM_05830 [Acidimicrobiia bacterium]
MTDGMARVDTREMLKRYAILAYGALGTMFDVGLMVMGSLLVGLSISVLLAGFGLVNVTQELSTGAMLASAMVLAVIGLFCLGVASEGPLGRGRRLVGFKLWEVGIGRAIAVLLVGLLALFAYGLVDGLLEGLPAPVVKGAEGVRAAGIAGLTVMPLIGVPLSLLALWYPNGPTWLERADVPIMFVVWAVATMAMIS